MISFFFIFSIIYIIFLTIQGMSSKPTFSSWHMFADLKMVDIRLNEIKNDRVIDFNHWSILPHTHLSMSLGEMKFLLQYLKYIKKVRVFGEAIIYDKNEVVLVKIENNHVLDY